jgi:hypothetical protein
MLESPAYYAGDNLANSNNKELYVGCLCNGVSSSTSNYPQRLKTSGAVYHIRWFCLLGRNRMNISRNFTEGKFFEMDFLAGIVNVNAYQITFGVIIEYNTFGDFFVVNTWLFREVDIKRIGLRIII